MASFRLTIRARADLRSIAEYTRTRWDDAQAVSYLDNLRRACQRIASNPAIGRADAALPRYLRLEQGKHVLFFRRDADGILVVRILHQRMLPQLHLDHEE